MRNARFAALVGALIGGTILLPASGHAGDGPSAVNANDCNRSCLNGFVDQYMAALVSHDPTHVPWARHVRFTENNVPMQIGDGLWNTITKQGAYKLYFADPQTGQAGFYGLVEEGSQAAVYGMRLKVESGRISEVETLLARKRNYRDDFPDPKGLEDTPILSLAVPPAGRSSREQLVNIADSYFKTLQQNDGTIYAPFDEHCDRVEDGVHTTNNPKRASSSGNAGPALGCEAQFKTGNFRFVTHIRDRRYPLVDEERGLVLAATFFDHAGSLRTVTLKDGSTRPIGAPFDTPYSFVIFELFKVVNGKIRQVEAVLEDVPYKTRSAWVE